MRDNEKTLKHTEVSLFYSSIQQKYLELMEELMQKDCQRVEFIRGALSVYSEILNQKKHWEDKSNYSYFK